MVGATGEWAGAIAVVVTLIYLSSQIRQSKLTTQQDMEQRRIMQFWCRVRWCCRSSKTRSLSPPSLRVSRLMESLRLGDH